MNRADRMYAALRDGRWHTRRDLFEHAGEFYLSNNAASELRARGVPVEQRHAGGNYEYRLREGSLPLSAPSLASPPSPPPAVDGGQLLFVLDPYSRRVA